MSITHAKYRNQLVTIEPDTSDGSNLTITCPINTQDYMGALQEIVQSWQPQVIMDGRTVQIATHAEILNSQVVCSLIPGSGSISESQLQRLTAELGHYLGRQTGRAMSAGVGTGPGGGPGTGEEDYEEIRGT